MDKKNRAAFGGFLHGNQKADFAGENPAEYLAPEVSVCDFALENGFALSVRTEGLSTGFYTGEAMENEYEITSSTTEGLNNAGSF